MCKSAIPFAENEDMKWDEYLVCILYDYWVAIVEYFQP